VIAPTITLHYPENLSNTSSTTTTFNFTATDNYYSVLNCSLLINGTVNQTDLSTSSGTVTEFTVSNLGENGYSWTISCNDSSSRVNTSEMRTFTVDTSKPIFNSLTTTPSSANELDPMGNITESANVTDNMTDVGTVKLQYRLNTASTYTNLTMSFDGVWYNATFNATTAGTYNIRIWANDTVNNDDFSSATNRTVQLDRTWSRTPVSFTPRAANLNENVTLGNLTINNTGDVALKFNITSDSVKTAYNESSNFTLAAKEVKTLTVIDNATAIGVRTITLNLSVNDTNADPTEYATTGTIIVATGQPILVASFTTPDTNTLSVKKGETGIDFIAKLENVGTGNATNVSFNMTFPEQWTITFGTATFGVIEELAVGDDEENGVTITIPNNATVGDFNVLVNASGENTSGADLSTLNLTYGDFVTVTVSETVTELVSGSGGSSGSSPGGTSTGVSTSGGGGTSVSKVAETEMISFTEEVVPIKRATSEIIPVSITNTYTGATMQNVQLELTGFIADYVTVSPSYIELIRSLQTREFTFEIAVPGYFTEAEYELTAMITADLVAEDPKAAGFTKRKVVEYRTFLLKVEELVEEDLSADIGLSRECITAVEEIGYNTINLEQLFQQAEEKISLNEFKAARELMTDICKLKKDALDTQNLLDQVGECVRGAEERWLKIPQTEDSLSLARLALERGEFNTALERTKNAQLMCVLETKGRVNILWFLLNYWCLLLSSLLFLILLLYLGYKHSLVIIIDNRLKNLNKEEEALQELLQEAQKKYLVERSFSETQYTRYRNQYEKRLTKIRQLRAKLRNKRVSILRTEQELSNIKKEKSELIELLKEDQKKYFVEGKISQMKFKDAYDLNKARLAEIEQEEMALEERLEKESGTQQYRLLKFLGRKKDVVLFFLTIVVILFLLSTCMWRRIMTLMITVIVFLVVGLGLYLLTAWLLRKRKDKKFWHNNKAKKSLRKKEKKQEEKVKMGSKSKGVLIKKSKNKEEPGKNKNGEKREEKARKKEKKRRIKGKQREFKTRLKGKKKGGKENKKKTKKELKKKQKEEKIKLKEGKREEKEKKRVAKKKSKVKKKLAGQREQQVAQAEVMEQPEVREEIEIKGVAEKKGENEEKVVEEKIAVDSKEEPSQERVTAFLSGMERKKKQNVISEEVTQNVSLALNSMFIAPKSRKRRLRHHLNKISRKAREKINKETAMKGMKQVKSVMAMIPEEKEIKIKVPEFVKKIKIERKPKQKEVITPYTNKWVKINVPETERMRLYQERTGIKLSAKMEEEIKVQKEKVVEKREQKENKPRGMSIQELKKWYPGAFE